MQAELVEEGSGSGENCESIVSVVNLILLQCLFVNVTGYYPYGLVVQW